MDFESFTTDRLEQRVLANRAEHSKLAAEDIKILEVLDHRQVATADGCRSMSEWTSARLDIGVESAKGLVRTMRRTVDQPDLRRALAAGEVTFDRVEALSRIPEAVGLLAHLDVAGVRREAAKRARISTETEYRTTNDRFLVLQPSLDESWVETVRRTRRSIGGPGGPGAHRDFRPTPRASRPIPWYLLLAESNRTGPTSRI